MRETGRVNAVSGRFAIVERERDETCSACDLKTGCGSAILGSILGRRRLGALALNRASARVGDRVEVAAEPPAFLRSALAIYMLPLLCLFAAAGGTQLVSRGAEPLTAAAGFLGLAVGCILLRYRFGRPQSESQGRLVIHRRLVDGAFESPGLTE